MGMKAQGRKAALRLKRDGERMLTFDGRSYSVVSGMAQVIEVFSDGRERILNPCLAMASARRYSANFNGLPRRSRSRSVVRSLPLACLARNALCKL